MLLFDYILVGEYERVLVIRRGRFEGILEPGEHIVFGHGVGFEKHDVRDVIFESVWADHIAEEHASLVDRHFINVQAGACTAIVHFNGEAARVVEPGGRMLFWRGPVRVTVKYAPREGLEPLSAVVCAVETAHD